MFFSHCQEENFPKSCSQLTQKEAYSKIVQWLALKKITTKKELDDSI